MPQQSHGAAGSASDAAIGSHSERGAETLAAYIGVCPTCLGWDDPQAPTSERMATPGRPVCPTCGLCSVEWDQAVAIDAELRTAHGLDRLDAAVHAPEHDES